MMNLFFLLENEYFYISYTTSVFPPKQGLALTMRLHFTLSAILIESHLPSLSLSLIQCNAMHSAHWTTFGCNSVLHCNLLHKELHCTTLDGTNNWMNNVAFINWTYSMLHRVALCTASWLMTLMREFSAIRPIVNSQNLDSNSHLYKNKIVIVKITTASWLKWVSYLFQWHCVKSSVIKFKKYQNIVQKIEYLTELLIHAVLYF